jgi:hypothetical protein
LPADGAIQAEHTPAVLALSILRIVLHGHCPVTLLGLKSDITGANTIAQRAGMALATTQASVRG